MTTHSPFSLSLLLFFVNSCSSEKSFTVYGRSQEEKEAWMVDLHQQLATLSPEGAVNGEDEG
jgi:hypothetical protein